MATIEKKEKKPFKGVKIWDFLNKIPAGTMFVPLVISAIITTICIHCGLGVSLWEYLGNPMKDLFGSTGQMLLIGLMLFCTGTTITPYGDDSDKGTFPIMLIFSMPLLPFIFLSCMGSGSSDITSSILQIFSLLIPFLLGVLLGNLDHKIRDIFKGGNAIILPFLGFQFGSTIDLVNAFQGEVILAALILTVIYWAVTMIIPYLVDRFILKRPGYASIASCSLAGVALSIPAMVATYTYNGISGADAAKNATAILAFVLLITNVLAPFFTKWTMNVYFKHHYDDAQRVFSRSHPELLTAVYDENGNYRTHHHNHEFYKKIFHIKSHKHDVNSEDNVQKNEENETNDTKQN